MKTLKTLCCALLGLALLAGCATRYNHDAPVSLVRDNPAPLAFADFPYTSLDGEAWPVARVKLPFVARLYNMPRAPEVAYVELNPDGERTIIFIHGLGSYLKFWRYQLDAFAARGYRVLALDMLGYGKSDKPASFPYTMEAMADVVREFANRLGETRPILVGHSMGGQTALSYAIRYPDELSGVVLASPAGFEEFTRQEREWYQHAMTTSLIKGASEYSIWGSIRRNNFYRWKDDFRWVIEERVRSVRTPEFDSYAYANVKSVQGLADNDFVRKNLEQVSTPALIIYGDKDRLIPNPFFHGGWTGSLMQAAHQRMPTSELVELHACGHMVQMDCSDEFNKAVLAFVNTELRPGKRRAARHLDEPTEPEASLPEDAPQSAPTTSTRPASRSEDDEVYDEDL